MSVFAWYKRIDSQMVTGDVELQKSTHGASPGRRSPPRCSSFSLHIWLGELDEASYAEKTR